jgi:multidrug efflux pump subunit AcrA (membrane-fusion protein)
MPRSVKLRLVPLALLAALAALLVAGCGGSSDDSSGGTDPASVAPASASVFIDATVRPEGETKTNIEALA